jgi:WD40 repeat protein
MNRYRRGMLALFIEASLASCLAAIVGCSGDESADAPSPAATPADADSQAAGDSQATASSAASTTANADSPAGESSTRAASTTAAASVPPPEPAVAAIPAPTAEQIAAWTPAAFEPLELLAVREWEKTSFTAQIAALPDGKHFLVAGSRVLLWSLDGDEPEHVFLELSAEDGDREILSLAVAPDGKWFAAGDSNGVLRSWSLEDRREIVTRDLESNGVTALAISPDGQEIATTAYDGVVSLWNADGVAPLRTFKVNTSGVERIAYVAPQMLAAAGETTTLWNTATGEADQELSPGRYSFALARSADGSRFLFGGDESLTVWDVAARKPAVEIDHGVSGSELVAFSPDGKFLATSNGRGFRLWNIAERRVVQAIEGYGYAVVGLAWLPQSNLLAVASEIGSTRVWGTAAAGAAAGLAPLHKPLALPAADSPEPPTPDVMQQVIDLRLLPAMPGSVPSIVGPRDYSAEVAATAEEAKVFYHYFLTQAGWTGTPAPPPNPAIEYRKGDFRLDASFYDAGEGKLYVSLHHDGSYDMRRAPKFDAAATESSYEGPGTVMYRTKANLLDIEIWLLRNMQAAGWTPYSRLHTSSSETPDARDMTFVRNGQTLRISAGKFPVDPESYTIQYSLFPDDGFAPVPRDAGFVEFDGSTEPCLLALTAMTLGEAQAFYGKELTAQGWLVREQGVSDDGKQAWVAALRGQCDVSVGMTKLPDGRTLVRVGDTGGSLWEASQAEPEPAETAPGLEAADFPALNASQTAAYDALGKSIEVKIEGSTLAAAAAAYIEALAALGWTEEEGGIRDEEYTLIDFTKDEQEITLRARRQDSAAVVNFEGDGLRWTKELPGGKPVISYETWLRLGKRPPGLEGLEEYEAEMRAISAN